MRLRVLSSLVLLAVLVAPVAAMDLIQSDLYRTDGWIHEIEISDGYIAWIESPEDEIRYLEEAGSPAHLYISDREGTIRISSPGMRPVLPSRFATQFGRVAWYGHGPDLPTDDVWLILYENGRNQPIRSACALAEMPLGALELRAAIEWPMLAFAVMVEQEGGELNQNIMLWKNGELQFISLVEFPGYHHFSPAIDSQRVVWCTWYLGDPPIYYVELWEGGVLVDLTDRGSVAVANTTADGRLILWNQCGTSDHWQPDNQSSQIYGWNESIVTQVGSSANGRRGAPYHNRRNAAWKVTDPNPAAYSCQIWMFRDEFSDADSHYPDDPAKWLTDYHGDPVISEDFLLLPFKWAGGILPAPDQDPPVAGNLESIRDADTEISIEWGSGYLETDTVFNEYMPRTDHPFACWVRDEGVSRVIVLTTPDADATLAMELNQSYFHPGDPFRLDVEIENLSDELFGDLYVVLAVGNQYWFWPSWTQIPGGRLTILEGETVYRENILDFVFPEVEDTLIDLRFYGALTWQATYIVIDWDLALFGFGP